MSEEDKPSDISEAEWLSRSSFMDRNYETPGQKLVRKCKETPLVPIGNYNLCLFPMLFSIKL